MSQLELATASALPRSDPEEAGWDSVGQRERPNLASVSDERPSLAHVAATLGAPLSRGNLIEPLFNGDEIFPPMLEAIASAGETICFLTYIYWKGDIARRFADALAKAAARGVEVRVLIDAVGGALMSDTLVARMSDAGCRVVRFNPLHRGSIRKDNFRTHRKVLVVDGRRGFTGGVGIGEEWTGDAQDADHWREDHFEIRGPVVAYLQGAFADNWHCETGELLSGRRFYPELGSEGPAAMISILGRPGSDPSPIGFAYEILFAAARRTISLATPYFVPDHRALEALCAASRRGVRVRLLIPGPHNDSKLAQWASEGLLPEAVDHGIEVYRYLPTMIHVKAATIDDSWTILGSANYDCRSFEINHELNLVVGDRDFTRRMTERFEHDLGRSKPVTASDLDELSWWKKLRSRAALMLRSQL